MDRKQSGDSSRRPSSLGRKRSFKGNRYTIENTTDFTSTSAKKLKDNKELEVNVNPTFNYCIIEFSVIFLTLQQLLKCKDCNGAVTFSKNGQRGLGFKLSVKCGCKETFILSSPLIDKAFEINRRLVLALRMLGVGFEGMKNFCGLMDLGQGICNSTYYSIVDNIKIAAQAVAKIVFKKALKEEVELNVKAGRPADELSVSGDGSWAKRGFSSLLGIVSLIGKYSNKILDVVIKCSICQGCSNWKGQEDTIEYEAWYREHEDHCDANHTGSAGKMEVDGIVEMFERSEELYNVKYANYIGDGDTKTFKALLDTKPYGDDFVVCKKECVLHVKKRLYKRALDAKKKHAQLKKATKKLTEEGKKIQQKAKKSKDKKPKCQQLTIKLLQELSTYYGLAIRRNSDSTERMRSEIWAAYYHKISTDENPQHSYCPPGSESWCKWRQSEAAGTLDTYEHPPALDDDAQQILKPIYEELTAENLLERCIGSNTQNNNESFNACVWHLAPKHLFAGKKIVDIATYISACIFNEGFASLLKIMETMGITIGPQAEQLARNRDERRVSSANRRSTDNSKEARTARQNERSEQIEEYERSEGILYGAGIAD